MITNNSTDFDRIVFGMSLIYIHDVTDLTKKLDMYNEKHEMYCIIPDLNHAEDFRSLWQVMNGCILFSGAN